MDTMQKDREPVVTDSDPPIYEPFMALEGVYDEGKSLTERRVLHAFQSIFGLPMGIISSEFRRVLHEVIEEEYPHLRCSAARAVIENRIPGISPVVGVVQPQWRKRLLHALYLMDLLETVAARYVEALMRDQPAGVRKDLETIRNVFGGVKLPGIMGVLSDAQQDKKAGKGHGGGSSRKGKAGDSQGGRQGVSRGG